ncbi:hypothetical protein [Pseudomonas xanthosomatis]|uniref:hypothetical protein n=1 Tax=Pseudomonas xanthosomatis TaxID=2842356 RepID=UPI0035115427
MSYFRRKSFWIVLTLIAPLIYFTASHVLKVMTSVYKKDLGNGVVIYADDYVKSGRWVFDCEYSRLIGRQPVTVPISELKSASKLTIGSMYSLKQTDLPIAKSMIRAVTAGSEWHKNLRYLYSGIDEYGNIIMHGFDMLVEYDHRQWSLRIWQHIQSSGTSAFLATANLYDPETYVDYTKALEAALKSCPAPQ